MSEAFDVSAPRYSPSPSGGEAVPDPGEVQGLQGPPATLGRARAPRHRRRTGAWPPAGAPRVAPNSLESVADDVAFWIETTANEVAAAMFDGTYAPFAARVSPEQAARFYGERLFTPQGSLEPAMWAKEYARLGAEGLASAINGGARWRRARGLPVALPVSKFQPTGVGMVGVTPAAGPPPEEEEASPPEGEGPEDAY